MAWCRCCRRPPIHPGTDRAASKKAMSFDMNLWRILSVISRSRSPKSTWLDSCWGSLLARDQWECRFHQFTG
jgi:hypothetical protein